MTKYTAYMWHCNIVFVETDPDGYIYPDFPSSSQTSNDYQQGEHIFFVDWNACMYT